MNLRIFKRKQTSLSHLYLLFIMTPITYSTNCMWRLRSNTQCRISLQQIKQLLKASRSWGHQKRNKKNYFLAQRCYSLCKRRATNRGFSYIYWVKNASHRWWTGKADSLLPCRTMWIKFWALQWHEAKDFLEANRL